MGISLGNQSFTSDGLVLYYNPSDPKNYLLNEVEVLLIGGGGGGSENQYDDGSGGGGGGFLQRVIPVSSSTAYTITVGTGGATGGSGTEGGNTSAFGLIAYGGGGASSHRSSGGAVNGASGGGSGGQYSADTPVVGRAIYGNQGNDGGASITYGGGGGGGAGSAGQGAIVYGHGGYGGRGRSSSISGTLRYYSGGGGGFGYANLGRGGIGGGGSPGVSPQANSGGGGGGGKTTGTRSTAGATGIVIIRYPGPQKATGGNTISFVNGYTVHTFTSPGTFTTLGMPSNGSAVYGLYDLSNNHNSCYSSGGPTYNPSEDGYIQFDGVDDFMNGSIFLDRSATYEFVAKADWTQNNGGTPIPIAIDGDLYASGPNLFFYNGTINNNTGDGGSNPFSGSSYPSSSVYVHFVVVNDFLNNTARLYQNGSLIGTANVLDMRTTGTNKFWIARWHGGGYRVNMRLGPVRVYNRALSAAEALQNFNSLRGRYGF